MDEPVLFTGDVTIATDTTYQITDGIEADEFASAAGDFAYDASDHLIAGTVTGWQHGLFEFSVTEFSFSAATLESDIAAHDAAGFVASLFGGDDSMLGGFNSDYLIGFEGNDTLNGNLGADTLRGGHGNDVLDGGDGLDVLDLSEATGGVKATLLENASDTTLDLSSIGLGVDTYRNIEGAIGTNYDDILVLSPGVQAFNTLYGQAGNDSLVSGSARDVLDGGDGNDTLVAGDDSDTLSGGAGADSLDGGDGRDSLDGGVGADTMSGGAGDDIFRVDDPGDVVIDVVEKPSTGSLLDSNDDEIISSVDIPSLPAHIEQVLLVGSATVAIGNALDNSIGGNDQPNELSGLGGNDSISGGAGGDTLIGGDGNDALGGGAGTDSIVGGTGDDSVGGGGENDTVDGGDGNDQLICGTGADSLIGGGGNDRFIVVNADHGQDTMAGGGGDDSYDVDDAGDVVIELPDQGTDTIYSTLASVTLPDNVENLVLYDGPANIRGIGNALDNSLQGSTGATELRGLAGNDTLEGDPYQSDTLIGGAGNDTYLIPYAVVGAPDVVIEQAGEGIDTLISGVSVAALADNVENLVLDPFLALSLPGPLTGVGNALSNIITGKSGAETLAGLGGNDTLQGWFNDSLAGGDGNDLVTGTKGQDTLDGGAGADTLSGGEGDDVYVQDSAGDVVIETGTTQNDELQTNQALKVAVAHVEHYTFTGTTGVNFYAGDAANRVTGTVAADRIDGFWGDDTLSGGAGNDTLIGGAGNNILDGGPGVDSLTGGLGADTYWVDPADRIFDIGGADTVVSSVSVDLVASNWTAIEGVILLGDLDLSASGNSLNNGLVANGGNDTLVGRAGNDVFDGGLGSDSLDGGDGNDFFFGSSGNDTISGGAGSDTIFGQEGVDLLLGGPGADLYDIDPLVDGPDVIKTGDKGLDVLAFTGFEVGWDFERVGNDLLITVFTEDAGGSHESDPIRIVDQYAGTGLAGFQITDPHFGVQGIYTPSGMTGTNQKESAELIPGSTGDDTIIGNGGEVDWLYGFAGDDSITGGSTATGFALLFGGDGNDTLGGGTGTGSNYLEGGAGDDLYIQVSATDVINETGSDSGDELRTNQALSGLVTNIEHYTYTGTKSLDFTGSDGDNRITAGSGADTLTGDAGDDTLNGGAGADRLVGGAGNDTYIVDNSQDVVVEQPNEGDDTVLTTATYQLPANVETLILQGTGAISGYGNSAANLLVGNAAANILDGKTGADTMIGHGGNDWYYVDDSDDVVEETGGGGYDTVVAQTGYVLPDFVEVLHLFASGAGVGNDFANFIDAFGGVGDNTLDGKGGADTLNAGAGDDYYRVDNAGDVVQELIAGSLGGHDTVESAISYTLGTNLEDLVLTGTATKGVGNVAANKITGDDAGDLLDGKTGADTMIGGKGDDVFIVDNVGDVVIDSNAGTDNDEIRTSVTPSVLLTTIENYTFTGAAAVSFVGNDLDNRITGTAKNDTLGGAGGDDTLDGKAGADTLTGGSGNDTYVLDNAKDVISETGKDAGDTVESPFSIDLLLPAFANIENAILLGAAAVNASGTDGVDNLLVGNAAANVLDGRGGADTMRGGAGNDTYRVDDGGDQVDETGGAGIDTVNSSVGFTLGAGVENLILVGTGDIAGIGNGLANRLTGNAGNNLLDGQGGKDTMAGGLGDDTYLVDTAGEVITEAAKGGTDLVQSSVTFSLAALAYVENLQLIGTADVNATGNALDNHLDGNSGNNLLNGGAGADSMAGDAGNDTYVVDNAGDVIDESGGSGTDTVQTTLGYTLGAGLENLTLTGTAAVNGIGNELDNLIVGNAAKNTLVGDVGSDTLNGGAGADSLVGGLGDDRYIVDNAGDKLDESAGGGSDTVVSSVSFTLGDGFENLTLAGTGAINGTGNALANVLVGNAAANILSGGDGDDILDGGNGVDKLIGGAGADTFLRHSLAEGKDTITDFTVGSGGDKLDIADILVGYVEGTSDAHDFVQCIATAAGTTVKVDANGTAGGAAFTDVCILAGVTTTLDTLLAGGNIELA
ncbi:MAG TPA: type I secretion C-terminal target domain-containing protein [Methylomirabilota bacterium]|nr:type I secretion C-terminal target domain-containing protein [Methylomirabilota bacterium]